MDLAQTTITHTVTQHEDIKLARGLAILALYQASFAYEQAADSDASNQFRLVAPPDAPSKNRLKAEVRRFGPKSDIDPDDLRGEGGTGLHVRFLQKRNRFEYLVSQGQAIAGILNGPPDTKGPVLQHVMQDADILFEENGFNYRGAFDQILHTLGRIVQLEGEVRAREAARWLTWMPEEDCPIRSSTSTPEEAQRQGLRHYLGYKPRSNPGKPMAAPAHAIFELLDAFSITTIDEYIAGVKPTNPGMPSLRAYAGTVAVMAVSFLAITHNVKGDHQVDPELRLAISSALLKLTTPDSGANSDEGDFLAFVRAGIPDKAGTLRTYSSRITTAALRELDLQLQSSTSIATGRCKYCELLKELNHA